MAGSCAVVAAAVGSRAQPAGIGVTVPSGCVTVGTGGAVAGSVDGGGAAVGSVLGRPGPGGQVTGSTAVPVAAGSSVGSWSATTMGSLPAGGVAVSGGFGVGAAEPLP